MKNDQNAPAGYTWTARVRWVGDLESVVYARNHAFTVGQPASFKETDPHPSAIEYLLGALGGDLTNGFQICASQKGIQIDNMELRLSGRLNNALVYLGVIGEQGDPGFAEITGTLYASADADEAALQEIWQTTLARSPIANTLKHSIRISIELKLVM